MCAHVSPPAIPNGFGANTHSRSKHVDIKYYFVKDQVTKGTVELKYCPTTKMVADLLTKGLPKDLFMKLRKMMGLDKCSDS